MEIKQNRCSTCGFSKKPKYDILNIETNEVWCILAKDDLIPVEGKIIEASRGSTYRVLLQNGITISARLSGKIKQFKIRVIVGDRVTVSLSPYDPTHGIITHRHK